MAECVLERTGVPEDDDDFPWCCCKNCAAMDTVEENVCCERQTSLLITSTLS